MSRVMRVIVSAVFFLIPSYICAQVPQSSTPAATHQHPAVTMIDGATSPDLISDTAAYRIFLYAVSTPQPATDLDRNRQHGSLMQSGLAESDLQVLSVVLSEFRTQYDALVVQYNKSAAEALAKNQTTDIHSLLRGFDALVQSTRDKINARLSPKAAAQFHAFVISEKKHMKTQVED